jgi:hypothetical protein
MLKLSRFPQKNCRMVVFIMRHYPLRFLYYTSYFDSETIFSFFWNCEMNRHSSPPQHQHRQAFIGTKNLLQNDFYKSLFKQFEKGLNTTLESFKKTMHVSILKVENRIRTCEENLSVLVKKRQKFYEQELRIAETLVNKELRSKVIISQWTNQFLSISVPSADTGNNPTKSNLPDLGSPSRGGGVGMTAKQSRKKREKQFGNNNSLTHSSSSHNQQSQQTVLDPITFAIVRFALNITLNYHDVNIDFILYTNVHKQLIHFISLTDSYMIIGPSLLALNHISLLNHEIKRILVSEGILQNLLILLTSSQLSNQVILSLCAKLCASLALEQLNKSAIAKSGLYHVFFDLILGSHCDINEMIQYYAITAIVNTLYNNEINRKYAIEINGIKPLLTVLKITSNNHLIAQTMHCLANISYGNAYTANCILIAGGGEVIGEILSIIDITREETVFIAEAAMAAYTNMCYSETNQIHIGNIERLLETTIRICEHGK